MADVFISYKREDRRAAEMVDARLRAEGYSTWWDTSLVAGDHWSAAINAELDAAACVVVLWSENSWASRWVQAEAHSGFERDILVAGRIDAVALKPPFNIVQTADLRGRAGVAGLEALVAGVRRKVGAREGDAPSALPTPPPQAGEDKHPSAPVHGARGGPSRKLPPWLIPAGGGAVVAGAIFAGLALLSPSPPAGETGRGQGEIAASAPHTAWTPAEIASRFLEYHRGREGVQETQSGLLYEVITSSSDASGRRPGPQAVVIVHYEGKLADGSRLESSFGGEPQLLSLGQVIPGWAEGLQLMRPGDEFIFYLPPELGYGASGAPPTIPPNAPLQYRVQLLAFRN